MNIPLSPTTINRRAFLGGAGLSLGSAALNMLMANNSTKPRYLYGGGTLAPGNF
jgi:hypothetical protein